MTKLMGILNVTPDSYFDGGKYDSTDKAVEAGLILEQQGADCLDIGGESTRPFATEVTIEEELRRVIPVIKKLAPKLTIPISIDTRHPEVAAHAIEAGASLLNDIEGFRNPAMRKVAAETGVTICVMHMQKTPQVMQEDPHYPNGVVKEILSWFQQRLEELKNEGIQEKNIIFDPGIGFGKTVAHNLEILHNLPGFRALGFPLLIGASRKSFIYKTLGKTADKVLPATLAVSTLAMELGVDWLRIHDVEEHRQIVDYMRSTELCSFR